MAVSQAAGAHPVALANLELLRQRLREALFAKKRRLRELQELCRAQRAELRGWIQRRRVQALKDLNDELRKERAAAAAMRRQRLQEARRASTSTVELARAAVEIERTHAAEQRRITQTHATKRASLDKAHARSLSEEELMSAATRNRLAPLLDKARAIRPAPGESRTEALWRYAHAHPEEMHALIEPQAERVIAQTRKEIAAAEEAVRTGSAAIPAKRALPPPKARKAKKAKPPKTSKARSKPTVKAPRAAASPRPPKPRVSVDTPVPLVVDAALPQSPEASAPPPPPPAAPLPAAPAAPPSSPRRSRAARPRPQLGLNFDNVRAAPTAAAPAAADTAPAADAPPESARQPITAGAADPPAAAETKPPRRAQPRQRAAS